MLLRNFEFTLIISAIDIMKFTIGINVIIINLNYK